MEKTPGPHPPEILALLAAAKAGKIEPDTLESAMGYLGGPEEILTLLLEPDPDEFDASILPDGSISEKRIDSLDKGARPSKAEMALWREVRLKEARESSGDGFHMVGVWRLPVSGPQLVCLHEDQGVVVEVLGPFASLDALRAALAPRGVVEE